MRLFIDVPRTIITVVAGVTATIVAVALIAVMVVVNDSSPLIEKIIRGWSRVWLAVSGTKLEIEGAENIDPNRSYVVVANHLSALDIMACLLAVPLPIRFLAKKELFRVPVLAQGMRMVGIIEVDRQARGAVHSEVNRQSRELIEKGTKPDHLRRGHQASQRGDEALQEGRIHDGDQLGASGPPTVDTWVIRSLAPGHRRWSEAG